MSEAGRHIDAHLLALLEDAPTVTYRCDAADMFRVTFVTGNVKHLTGYDASHFLGCRTFAASRIHPDDFPFVRAGLRSLRKAGAATLDYRFLHADGAYRWLRDQMRMSDDGMEAVGCTSDITDLKREVFAPDARDVSGREAMAALLRDQADDLTTVVQSARCILWRSHVEAHGDGFAWTPLRRDIEQFQAVLPLDVSDGEDYHVVWRSRIPVEDQERLDRVGHQALREGADAYSIEYRAMDKYGATRWLRDDVSIKPIGEGQWQAVGVLTDITQRKRSEQIQRTLYEVGEAVHVTPTLDAMYESIHASLANLVDSTGFAVALTDPDEPDLFSFAHWRDTEGVKPGLQRVAIPNSRTALVAHTKGPLYLTAQESERMAEAGDIELYEPEPAAWLGVPLMVDGGFIGVMRLAHHTDPDPYTPDDIEVVSHVARHVAAAIDRRRTQEKFAEERRLFLSLMDSLPDSIYFKDAESKVTRVNAVCAKRMGVADRQDAAGVRDSDVFEEELATTYRNEEIALLATGEPIIGDVRRDPHTPGGWISVTKVPIQDDAGEITGLVGANRDVTELMRAQEELRDSETGRMQLMEQVLTAQEEERARISRELHDQVGGELTSLLLGLRVIQAAKDVDDATRQAGELRDIAADTLEDVRKIAFAMRPSVLDDLGLAAALQRDVELLNQGADFNATFHAHRADNVHMPSDVQVGLYRAAHTALTNVVRHAAAQNVAVAMSIDRVDGTDRVSILIEDDGVGFDARKALSGPVAERFGLLSMQERARLMGGEVTIQSAPGEGCAVLMSVPTSRGGVA